MLNEEFPKTLREDIEWAVDVISANKLYTGNLNDVQLDTKRPEIRAWTELISMERIPLNIEEMKRLKEYEELHKLENQKI